MKKLTLLLSIIFISLITFAQTSPQTYTTSGTFVVPAGVTQLTVECWGGGGAGGGGSNNGLDPAGAGGGAGGAYVIKLITVIPGNTYTVTVGGVATGNAGDGADGNPSWFGTVGTVYAQGGAGGSSITAGDAPGGVGSTASSIGDVLYAGGTGANGVDGVGGGGGGGGAGTSGIGGNGTDRTGGTGTATDGGNGGTGGQWWFGGGNGTDGSNYGGGGGGGYCGNNTNRNGGDGAQGLVVISWTPSAIVYYSQSTSDPGTLTNWNTETDGSGSTPADFTTDNQSFIIQNGHNMTTTGAWTVSGTNSSVQISSGGTLTASNTVTISTLYVNDGGTFAHNINGGAIPTATWDDNSTLNITGVTTTMPTNWGQTFGNVTWNSASQTADIQFGNTLAINGDLTIQDSNTGSIVLANGTSTVAEDYIHSGGELRISGGSANTLDVSGDFSISGGTLDMSTGANAGTLNLYGDFDQSGGTITESGTSSGDVNFIGSSTQNFIKSAGTISNTVDFDISSGSTIDMADYVLDGSSGTFTLNSGANLVSGHQDGIYASTANGNVQVTGTRTFDSGANYWFDYSGAGSQNTGTGFTAATDVTINSTNGAILTSDATISGNATLNSSFNIIGRTLTLNGPNIGGTPTNLTTGNTTNLVYGGSSSGISIPSSVSQLSNLTINNSNGVTLSNSAYLSNDIALNGGNLILDDYNVSVSGSVTTSAAFDNGHMIVTDGSGSLVKIGSATGDFQITYPVGTGTYYTPMVISSITATVAGGSDIIVRAIPSRNPNLSFVYDGLLKYWLVSSTGITSITDVQLTFQYNANEVIGSDATYEPRIWTGSAFNTITNPTAAGANPFGTAGAGNTELDGEWTAFDPSAKTTYYSYKNGNWNDSTSWTLDPSGALYNNPSGLTPRSNDKAVIFSGKTIIMTHNDSTVSSVNVEGVLDLDTTSGHTMYNISGSGTIRIEDADNFPTYTTNTLFSTDQGTLEYYGDSFTLNTARNVYNLEVNMTAGQTLTLLATPYNIAGDLTISNGTFRINDNTATTQLRLTVNNDITIESGASFTVGQGNTLDGTETNTGSLQFYNVYHTIDCYGDFINDGTVSFTNQTAPDYDDFTTTGAISLFISGATNNSLTCQGTTDLYNLVIDKGSDNTYTLTLYSSAEGNFRLYGNNNLAQNATAPFSDENPEIRKALWIRNGTLEVTGYTFIPSLTEGGGDYYIPANAMLWVNGANAKVWSTDRTNPGADVGGVQGTGVDATTGGSQSFSIYGDLKVSDGYFTTGSHGIVMWYQASAFGSILVEGGQADVPGIRTAAGSSNGKFSFTQTGGLIKFLGGNGNEGMENVASLALLGTDATYTVSGGTMEFYDGQGWWFNDDFGLIRIETDATNISVTGGTIHVIRDDANGNNYDIYSNAPFYNLILSGIGQDLDLDMFSDWTVLNDLTINDRATLDATWWGDYDLTIGGDFSIGNTTTTNTAVYDAQENTTTFNGDGNSVITVTNTNVAAPLTFYDLVIDKTPNSSNDTVSLISTGRTETAGDANNYLVTISNSFTINEGTFNYYRYKTRLSGNYTNYGTSLGDATNTGRITLENGAAQFQITGSTSSTIEFGDIELNDTDGAVLNSHGSFNEFILTEGVMDIGTYNMAITGGNGVTDGGGNAYSTTKMIQTYGSPSSQGVTVSLSLSGTYSSEDIDTIPVGVGGVVSGTGVKYTPLIITLDGNIGAGPYTGTLNLRPVDENHPTSDPVNLGDLIPYYWKTTSTGNLSSITSSMVDYTFTESYGFDYSGGKKDTYFRNNAWDEEPGSDLVFLGYGFETTDYSVGKKNSYKTIQVLYSRQTGQWQNTATWSLTDHATTDEPAILNDFDIRYISGSDGANHQITVPTGVSAIASGLVIRGKSESGISTGNPPSLIITAGTSGHDFYNVTGNGRFVLNDATMPNGDFNDFCLSDEAIFEYSGGTYIIPSSITTYPNLWISGDASSIKTSPPADILVRKNLYIYDQVNNGVNLYINSGSNGDITINDSLVITNQGKLVFPNGTNNRTVDVLKNIDYISGGAAIVNSIEVESGGTFSDPTHELKVQGDIRLGASTLTLWRSNSAKTVDLILDGNTDSRIYSSDSNNIITLSKLDINKGTSALSVTFDEEFSINAPTNTATKPLSLQQGILDINNAGTILTLSSGTANFTIPATSTLILNDGTLDISGNDIGLNLEGALDVNGGTFHVYNATSTNNYIQYYTTGYSSLTITGGTLRVGSQIRRLTTTTGGILDYDQSGGTVEVGYSNAPTSNRGVLEVINTGSSFSFTGGSLTVFRGQVSATVPSFNIAVDAADANIGSGTTLNIGGASGSPEIGIYSTVPVHHLSITATGSPTAKVWTADLDVNGDLDINTTSTFDANGQGLTIKGDFTNDGVFLHTNNTTTFDGSSNQTITGETTFYDFIDLCSDTLKVGDDIEVENDFSLSNGVISDQGNNIRVLGDLTIADTAEHTYGGAVGSSTQLGIHMNGTVQQSISGSGTFGKITIENGSSVKLPVGSSILIEDALRMNAGVFDIQGNLLALGLDCEIEGSGFNENKMIQTNVSFTDNGVKKTFPQNGSTFLYPIGSVGKYTPVYFDITANGNNTGTITVKAANEIHPSCIVDDTEATCQLVDEDNVLQYHWVLKSNGITGFTSTCTMYGDVADIEVNNACGLTAVDYITAKLLANSTSWNKYDTSKFNHNTAELSFDLIGNSASLEGDYTAGLDDAIPDSVAAYETIDDGDWTDVAIWQPFPITGPAVPVGGPRGCIAIINPNDTVDVNNDGEVYIYQGEINGTLNLNTTYAHRLGYVIGTGTLKMVDMNNLPAGDYSGTGGFITATGGTLEYAGSTNYTVLSDIPLFNSVRCSGSGERELPNIDITAYGDVTIAGADVVNAFDKNLTINGNFIMSSGTYDAGIGTSTITFTGTSAQYIDGLFTAANSNSDLYNLAINKTSSNVSLYDSVEVSQNLALTSGNFITTSDSILTLTSALTTVTGGGSSSFVDGPLRKGLDNLDDFTFPVGDGTRYGYLTLIDVECTGTEYWIGEYFETAFGDLSVDATLTSVSNSEYWKVNSPVDANTAFVQLRWDPLSDINPTTVSGGYTDISVAEYDGADWIEKSSTNQTNNNSNGTVETDAAIPINTASNPQYYTLGSNSTVKPSITLGSSPQICETATSADLPYTATTGDPLPNRYSIDYDATAEIRGFVDIAIGDDTPLPASPISLTAPGGIGTGTYNATIQVWNSGTPANISNAEAFTITLAQQPNAITGEDSICVGAITTLSCTPAGGVWSSDNTSIATINAGGDVTGVAPGNVDINYTVNGCARTLAFTVNPLPVLTLTVNAALDTICDGDNTEIDLNLTTGTVPYTFTISDGTDTFDGTSAANDPYIPAGNMIPVWVTGGASATTTYTVTVITDNNGCTNTGDNTVNVVVYKVPETGPQYHISNQWQ